MKKKVFLLFFALSLLVSGSVAYLELTAKRCNPKGACRACTNCNYCGHCAGRGGSCSVCR